ncbi:hypothetical protein GCM10027176_38540 [Actinoallomurus bryophytorum]
MVGQGHEIETDLIAQLGELHDIVRPLWGFEQRTEDEIVTVVSHVDSVGVCDGRDPFTGPSGHRWMNGYPRIAGRLSRTSRTVTRGRVCPG